MNVILNIHIAALYFMNDKINMVLTQILYVSTIYDSVSSSTKNYSIITWN